MNAQSPVPVVGPVLSAETFDRFRVLIHRTTGISVRDGKQILIANRLRRRLVSLGLPGYEQYYELLLTAGHEELRHFIDAVSTNETYFYREGNHFASLAAVVLPELFRTHQRITIWSAGCSTGEEVYTLRIVADEAARAAGGREVRIIGTDISTTVITRAREGIYGPRAVHLVPAAALAKHFQPLEEGLYQVSRALRDSVEFRVHNLFKDRPPAEGINIIFCRNVMIYFDKETQEKLVDHIFADAIDPEGYLFIGHSESLSGFTRRFTYASLLKAPIYRRRQEAAA